MQGEYQMSAKLKVICQKDENGRLNWIEIYKGRSKKPLRLEYIWDADGLTREINFFGRRQDMLSVADVVLLFNEKFMERIGLISKIETIEEIVNVNISSMKSGYALAVKTIGALHVDVDIISAITLNINLKSSDITLNIHETGTAQVDITSSIQLNMNIAASAITLNIHETGTANVAITSSIQLNMNIAASAITVDVKTAVGEHIDVDITSSIQLNINLAASDITLNIHETGTANVAVTSSIQLNVNVAGSAITVDVHETGTANVAITSSITVDMSIIGATINVPVETAEGAKVDVNIISTITLNVNLHTQTANINVDIKAQTVDLNIKTSGATNIVIDLLEQGAIFDRKTVIENQAETATGDYSQNLWGKFFSRGCMGHLRRIIAYVSNNSGADADIVLGLAIHPNGGEIDTVTITAVNGDSRTERWGELNRWWAYDKLFIYVKSGLSANVKIAFDTVEKPDQYYLSAGKWTYTAADNCRLWIKADYAGLTVSDLPITGTVNNIEIPSKTTPIEEVTLEVPADTELMDTIRYGAGQVLYIIFRAFTTQARDNLRLRIKTDGNFALPFNLTFAEWEANAITPTSPMITVGKWDTENNWYAIIVTIPYEFQRTLQVGFKNKDVGAMHTGHLAYIYKKIS